MKSTKQYSAFIALILLLGAFPETVKAGCIRGEVEWQHASTNLIRCGARSLTDFNTYFGVYEEIQTHVWIPQMGNYASNYYRKTYTFTIMPYGDCYGMCNATNITFYYATDPPWYSWDDFPAWTGSPLPNGFTNISPPVAENYSVSENIWDYGEYGNSGVQMGTEKMKYEWKYYNPHTIETFAADALSYARGRWSNGLPYYGQSALLRTQGCPSIDNYKNEMQVNLLRYRIRFMSAPDIAYKVLWSVRLASTERTNIVLDLSQTVAGNGTTNYTAWTEMPEPNLEETYSVEVFNIRVQPDSGLASSSASGCTTCGDISSRKPGVAKDGLAE
jgi:hypothetical protein